MHDIASMIVPRPLLVVTTLRDPWIPIEAAKDAFEHLKKVYKLLDAYDKTNMDVFDGQHEWRSDKALSWLDRWL